MAPITTPRPPPAGAKRRHGATDRPKQGRALTAAAPPDDRMSQPPRLEPEGGKGGRTAKLSGFFSAVLSIWAVWALCPFYLDGPGALAT